MNDMHNAAGKKLLYYDNVMMECKRSRHEDA
jgi:hypothetical protein